jgi:TetR/AcrR family transcriptional regulator of autoinduction and epiphytic fitness
MAQTTPAVGPRKADPSRRDQILDATIGVVGRLGFRQASVDDIASAAGISKQGLYLHFASKDELVEAAMRRYFSEGLRIMDEVLRRPGIALSDRLVDALDGWFGRHLVHFNPATLEMVQPRVTDSRVELVKDQVRSLLAEAIRTAPGSRQRADECTPEELAQVLFQFGMTWKDGHASREAFRRSLELCVKACVHVQRQPRGWREKTNRRTTR